MCPHTRFPPARRPAQAAPACSAELELGRNVQLTCGVEEAAALFETEFHVLSHAHTDHRLVRAASYSLPEAVEDVVAAAFGLHGLPLPPRHPLIGAPPSRPANVTPDVLITTYGVKGVKPRQTDDNRMSVAEFQGQVRADAESASRPARALC